MCSQKNASLLLMPFNISLSGLSCWFVIFWSLLNKIKKFFEGCQMLTNTLGIFLCSCNTNDRMSVMCLLFHSIYPFMKRSVVSVSISSCSTHFMLTLFFFLHDTSLDFVGCWIDTWIFIQFAQFFVDAWHRTLLWWVSISNIKEI